MKIPQSDELSPTSLFKGPRLPRLTTQGPLVPGRNRERRRGAVIQTKKATSASSPRDPRPPTPVPTNNASARTVSTHPCQPQQSPAYLSPNSQVLCMTPPLILWPKNFNSEKVRHSSRLASPNPECCALFSLPLWTWPAYQLTCREGSLLKSSSGSPQGSGLLLASQGQAQTTGQFQSQ